VENFLTGVNRMGHDLTGCEMSRRRLGAVIEFLMQFALRADREKKEGRVSTFHKNILFKPLHFSPQLSVLFKFQHKPFARLCHRRISNSELRADCS
jgi:hypothetical protein